MSRARSLFGKQEAVPTAEPFAIRCICGRKVEGVRRSEHQTVPCENCGAAVFVLPISPLAPPGPAKKPKRSEKSKKRVAAATEADVSELADSLDVERPVRKRPAILDRKWQKAEEDEEEKPPPKPWLSRKQTIGLASAAAVLLASFVVYRQLEYRDLRDRLPERARQGLKLFDEGKFDEAFRPLQLADRAVGWARIPFPEAKTVRQAYAEVAMSRDMLVETLDAAVSAVGNDPREFARRCAGRAVLLDLDVERDPEGGWIQSLAIPVGDDLVELHSRGLKIYDDLNIDKSRRVIVAARLESVEKVDGKIRIKLDHASGVAITRPAMLKLMGLEGDRSADDARRVQEEWVQNVQ